MHDLQGYKDNKIESKAQSIIASQEVNQVTPKN